MIELTGVALPHPRGGSSLVSDATLAVERGQVVLVVAAAGLGSSRLLAAMLGEADCSAGHICLLGHDVGKLRRASLRKLRRKVGIVPQELCLLEYRSAQLNVVMPLEIDGVPRSASAARAAVVLEALGLAAEAQLPVDALSRSARQRVAVARALIRQPEILLADHPTSDQDAAGAQLVCHALDRAAAAGAACVVFSRDPMLRVHAETRGWGQWLLADGVLRPLHEGATESLEELEISIESMPLRGPASPSRPALAPASGSQPALVAASASSHPALTAASSSHPALVAASSSTSQPVMSSAAQPARVAPAPASPPTRPPSLPSSAPLATMPASISASILTSAPFGSPRPSPPVAATAASPSSGAATAVDAAEAAEISDEPFAKVLPFPGTARAGAR